MPTCSASPPRFSQIVRVRVAIQNRVGHLEPDKRVQVGRCIVQKRLTFFTVFYISVACYDDFSSIMLILSNPLLHILQEATNYLLDTQCYFHVEEGGFIGLWYLLRLPSIHCGS